jgi:NADH-quinone oxidoreductase subunit G
VVAELQSNAYEVATGEELPNPDFEALRGVVNHSRDVKLNLKGTDVIIRVVSTLAEAEESLQEIKNGEAAFQMLEVIACPGGCINGGGQPRSCDNSHIKEERAKGLYRDDAG